MERNFRVARACVSEAVREFSWREYAPFGWILAVQLLFLVLALNLSSPIGMGTVGLFVRMFQGDAPLHYPAFFLTLPGLASLLEVFLYTVPGAVLIPLSILRVMSPMEGSSPDAKADRWARLKAAVLPTLVALVANALVLLAWQWLFQQALFAPIRTALPGIRGVLLAWAVTLLGAYIIAALFLYVPVIAVQRGSRFGDSIRHGLLEGLSLIRWTSVIILLFALPALPFLAATQFFAGLIIDKMRPEMVGIALGLYMIAISVASYLAYATATRLHWAARVGPE